MTFSSRALAATAAGVVFAAACAGSAVGFSIDKSKTLLLGQLTHGTATDGVHEEVTKVAIVSQLPRASTNLIAMIQAGAENVDITHHFDSEYHFDSASVTPIAKPGQRDQFRRSFAVVAAHLKGAAPLAGGNPEFFEPTFSTFRGIAADLAKTMGLLASHRKATVTQRAALLAAGGAVTVILGPLVYNESPDHHRPTSERSLFTLTLFPSCGVCGVFGPLSVAARAYHRTVEKASAYALTAAAAIDPGGPLQARAQTIADALSAYRAFQAVGHAFHATQDFFAHSNYVELLAGVKVGQRIRPGTRVPVPRTADAFDLDGVKAVLGAERFSRLETGASNAIWLGEGDFCLGSPYNPRTFLTINVPEALVRAFRLPRTVRTPALGGTNPNSPEGLNYCHYPTRTNPGLNKDEKGTKEPSHVNHQVAKKAAADMTAVLWRDFLAPLSRPVKAPALRRMDVATARRTVEQAGLSLVDVSRTCTAAELAAAGGGRVLSQSPPAGALTRPAGKVTVASCKQVAGGGGRSGGGGGGTPGKVKPPTTTVCVPKTIRLEYFSSLNSKLGEYDAPFGTLVRVYEGDDYHYKCLWMTEAGGAAEAFVVFIDLVPPGLPGTILSGDCGRNRPDSPPFYHSRKRYLTVSGGNRISFQNAVGGNEKIIKGVLAAAEAAGIGQACPKA